MKKKIFILICVFLAAFTFTCLVADNNASALRVYFAFSNNEEVSELGNNQMSGLILPTYLEVIEEEAFSGTAAETVVFPKGFLWIGAYAFDDSQYLTDVYIPETTEYIADSAFYIASNLTIHGIDSSYAKEWASRHNIPFVVDDYWNIINQSLETLNAKRESIIQYTVINLLVVFPALCCAPYEKRSRRPQDRPELYPIEYKFP